MAQSFFPPYPDPVVEPDRTMRKSWVGFFQAWLASWDQLLKDTGSLPGAVASVEADVAALQTMGQWIDVPFNAANFYTSGGVAVWTVAAGGVTVNKYTRIGNTILWQIKLSSTLTGSENVLQITCPAGIVLKSGCNALAWNFASGGVAAPAVVQNTPDGRSIQLVRFDVANWPTGVGLPNVMIMFIGEVQ